MRIRIHSHDFRHHKEKLFTEVQIWHNKNLNKIDSLRLSENALCLMNKTNKCYASSDSFLPTTFKFRLFCYRTQVRNTWLVMVFFLLFQFRYISGKGNRYSLGTSANCRFSSAINVVSQVQSHLHLAFFHSKVYPRRRVGRFCTFANFNVKVVQTSLRSKTSFPRKFQFWFKQTAATLVNTWIKIKIKFAHL